MTTAPNYTDAQIVAEIANCENSGLVVVPNMLRSLLSERQAAMQGQGGEVADLEPFREAIVFACTNGNIDKWRPADVATTGVPSIKTRGKADTVKPAQEQPGWKVPDGWADAYAAFKGTFDTPAAWLKDGSEYANDARKRLRDFNEAMISASPTPPKEN